MSGALRNCRRSRNSRPGARDANHAAHSGVDPHNESEIRQSVDNPLRGQAQFWVAAYALAPAIFLSLMNYIVDGDAIRSVLEKAGQDSVVIASDRDEAPIADQG